MPDKPKTDRRSFLKLAGSGTVGVIAVATGAEAASPGDAKPADGAGYSETEHVKKVYELARF